MMMMMVDDDYKTSYYNNHYSADCFYCTKPTDNNEYRSCLNTGHFFTRIQKRVIGGLHKH